VKYFDLTYPDNNKEWHESLVKSINKDFPDAAILTHSIKGYSVSITEYYRDFVKRYVLSKCRCTDLEKYKKRFAA
jgi:hypothetical protein